MKQVTTMLGELLKIFPRYEFEKLEKQHQSNHYTKYFTGWQQLITLLYAQIVGHDSLRGIKKALPSILRNGTTSAWKTLNEVRCPMI